MQPQRVVYVSCDPATLARDLKLFAQQGYQALRAAAVDMFPRTVHVETVVLLSRKMPDDTIDIDLELDELDITATETKATY
jgi:23S rRNA (uracil1939-C5)-methyltransferase